MSCEEDISQCHAAVDLGIPVVTSEFLLTGILQQKLDIDAYPLHRYFVKLLHTLNPSRQVANHLISFTLHTRFSFSVICKCCSDLGIVKFHFSKVEMYIALFRLHHIVWPIAKFATNVALSMVFVFGKL